MDEYLKNSKEIQLSKLNEEIANYSYDIKKSDYLPTLSLSSSYGYDFSDNVNDDNYDYGLKVSIPIDFSSLNNIEKYRLNYLLSKKKKNKRLLKNRLNMKK